MTIPRILLVEDDRALALHWQQALEVEGFQVIHEPSVEGAIDVLDSMSIDLVITDIVLESDDEQLRLSGGLAVISYIALNVEPQPKIIATSGGVASSAFVDRNFQKMSSLRAMRKPIAVDALVNAVKELLRAKKEVQPQKARREIQEALHSKLMLDVLGATDGVWDWVVETNEIQFSSRWRKLLGFDGDDLVGMPNTLDAFRGRVHPDDRERLWKGFNRTLVEGVPYVEEYRLQNKEGDYIWVESRGQASLGSRGQPARLVGSTHDISERRKTQRELLLSRAALANAGDAVFMVNQHGCILFVNETACESLGYGREELLRMSIPEIDVDVPSQEFFESQILPQVESQQNMLLPGTHRRKDGSTFPVEIAAVLVQKDNETIIAANVRDITDRREAEIAILSAKHQAEESEARFRLIADSAPALVWKSHPDGSFTWVNEYFSKYFERTRGSICRASWQDLVHPDDAAMFDKMWESDSANKAPEIECQCRLIKHNLENRWHQWRAVQRFDSVGNLVGYVGIATDVHVSRQHSEELQRLNSELSRTNADLEQFAYVASHDLLSPLRGIATVSSILREDEDTTFSESGIEFLDKLDIRVKRMETLVKDLLAYSRASRQRCLIEEVRVQVLIEQIVELLDVPDGFQISIGDMPALSTYATPLRQVFLNLIGNAIKHHDQECGKIEITAQEFHDYYRFAVTDDGPGIDEAYHQKIFKLFQRLQLKKGVDGSGMGLALVQRLVGQYGGEIKVDPDFTEGTRFIFTWPKELPEQSVK